jgi:hypothetical protein
LRWKIPENRVPMFGDKPRPRKLKPESLELKANTESEKPVS